MRSTTRLAPLTICVGLLVLALSSPPEKAQRMRRHGEVVRMGKSWFSKVRLLRGPSNGAQAADDGTMVFDLVVSLYGSPSGDDDPDNDTGAEEQTDYEEILRFFADAICEQANGALKLGKVRIFRNGIQGSLADIVWNESEWPRAGVSGFGVAGRSIIFGDVFPDGCGTGCDIDFLSSTRHEDAGYTLGHEFGHYVLGVYDEYRGSDPAETRIYFPQTGDDPVSPSIMNSQWNADGGNFEWLNHSTEDNYEAVTAQGRVFGASAWEVLIQDTDDDPKDGDRSTLPQRVRYTALVGEEPTAADGWVLEELPGAQADCRSELEIIWMQDDIEMQLVIDRSFSMDGTPLGNAQQAAKTLVDEVEDGKTALGVVSFNHDVAQSQPIVAIPDPPGTVKDDIKAVIDALTAGGDTAMFDAADLALTNLLDYATTNGTSAAQLVFLLSDGLDNSSSETQSSVISAYQSADVPLVTFAYGAFAPDGVLRELAEETGGLFRASPTDLAEISSAFLSAKAALTSSAAVIQQGTTVAGGGSAVFPFAVDSTLQELSIFANHPGSAGDVDFSVMGPLGAVPVSFACTEVAGAVACGAVIDAADIAAQGTGGWSVVATNTTGSPVTVNVDILATPTDSRTFDLVVAQLTGSTVEFPQPLLLTASVSQGLPITAVEISATITDPLGTVTPLSLVDTGMDGDGIAGDGTYSAIVGYSMDGLHTVEVLVENPGLAAHFTTDGFQPAHPRSAGTDGETPMAPVPPPIVEAFTRTATTQILVQGFMADDHPDSAPGTSVPADNGDVPGQIDFPGDPDVFTVSAGSLEHLTFRVTGLALGMAPHLRVLAADGTTELFAGTIDDLLPGAPYLAVTIPTGGAATFHAEVTHRSSSTGAYLFSAGAQLASDPPMPVPIDIKPGACPNPFNRSGNGVLSVGLLGDADFDVTSVDLATVTLVRADGIGTPVSPNEGPPGPASRIEDVGTPFDGTACDCHDLGEDGIADLSMKFRTSAIVPGLELADEPNGGEVVLGIAGELEDGTRFLGLDCVQLVPMASVGGVLRVTGTQRDAWIECEPEDVQLDGGGFTPFDRAYTPGTTLWLTAERQHEGRAFRGWLVKRGNVLSRLITEPTLKLDVTAGLLEVQAVYR